MEKLNPSAAQQIAQAAIAFQQERTGHEPQSVAVVLSGDTLLITLHGALSPAEKALASSPEGAAQVQDFHRQLFTNSAEKLRQEIKRITGVEVREATAEVETTTGTVVQVFTTGTMVQVFLLAQGVPAGSWSGNRSGEKSQLRSHVMQATIELPKAFSARDDREIPLIQDLMTRLNPKLLVIQVATGVHVDGGSTVNWGLVHLDGQPLLDTEVHAALEEAGLDSQHSAEIQVPRIWVNNHPEEIETTPA